MVLKAKHTFGFEGNKKKSCSCNCHSADASSPRWSSDGISESLQFHSDSFYFIIFLFSIKFPSWSHGNVLIVSPRSKHDECGDLPSLRPSVRRTWKRRLCLRQVFFLFFFFFCRQTAAEILLTPPLGEPANEELNATFPGESENRQRLSEEAEGQKVGKAGD